MKRHLLALLLAMTMLFTLTACGSKNEETPEDEPAVEGQAPLPEEEDVVIESEVVDPRLTCPLRLWKRSSPLWRCPRLSPKWK